MVVKLLCSDLEKRVLKKLLPHLDVQKIMLVGGIAMRHHLLSSNINMPKVSGDEDIDIIAKSPSVVKKSITKDFLIWHYHNHPNHERLPDDFYFAIVDSKEKCKVDIFDFKPYYPQESVDVKFGGVTLKTRTVEDQLVIGVLELARIMNDATVEPKKTPELIWLLQICDLEKVEKLWRTHPFNKWKTSFIETLNNSINYIASHPQLVLKNVPSKEIAQKKYSKCSVCLDSSDFPLAPLEKVKKALSR
jgi:hypothetical protein